MLNVCSTAPVGLYSTMVLAPARPVLSAPLPYSAQSEPPPEVRESSPLVPVGPVVKTVLVTTLAMARYPLRDVCDARTPAVDGPRRMGMDRRQGGTVITIGGPQNRQIRVISFLRFVA